MSEPVSISSGIAARYATAVFEIAKESGALASLENDIDALAAALDQSADFVSLIKSPIYSRAEAGAAIGALAKALGLSQLVSNTLGLMAAKRRLFVLPQLLAALREQIARDKGEVTAEVISAKALTKAQTEKLAAAIKSGIGKDVNLNAAVDESLIGGLVVKVGSTMIDSSIKAKLANLQNAMKEVG